MSGALDLTVVGAVFGVVFVAQLPGKSAFAALLLATRESILPVALGAAAALAIHSAIAVGAGGLVALLPTRWVHVGAGFVFLVSAAFMWRPSADAPSADRGTPDESRSLSRTFALSFAAVFIAEWGDLTQLGTAALAARYRRPLDVFAGATLGLWAATMTAILVGNGAGRLLRPAVMRKVAAVLFALVGAALVASEIR